MGVTRKTVLGLHQDELLFLGGRIVVPLGRLGKRWLTTGKRTLFVGRKSVPSEPGEPSVHVKSTFHAGKIGQCLIGNRLQPLIEGLEPAFRWVLQKPEFRLGRLSHPLTSFAQSIMYLVLPQAERQRLERAEQHGGYRSH
ncbi:MAG: hypothetical protein E6K70_18405, partial [Planctomycetota bacterium]